MASSGLGRRLVGLEQQRTRGALTEGRALLAASTARAGLLAAPVVAGLEDPEAWRAHLRATCADLGAVGHLEALLAERAALALWKLARLDRYEQEAADRGQAAVEADYAHVQRMAALMAATPAERLRSCWPEDIRYEMEYAENRHTGLMRMAELGDGEVLEPAAAADALGAIYRAACPGEDAGLIPGPEQGGQEEFGEWCGRSEWTGALLRQALAACAAHAGTDPAELLERVTSACRFEAAMARKRLEEMEGALAEMRQERLLLAADRREALARTEAHLQRSLQAAIDQLARLQDRRSAQPAATGRDSRWRCRS